MFYNKFSTDKEKLKGISQLNDFSRFDRIRKNKHYWESLDNKKATI